MVAACSPSAVYTCVWLEAASIHAFGWMLPPVYTCVSAQVRVQVAAEAQGLEPAALEQLLPSPTLSPADPVPRAY